MRSAVVGLLALLGGCGRIEFDALSDASDATHAGDASGTPHWTLVSHASVACGGPVASCTVPVTATQQGSLLVAISTANTVQVPNGTIASVTGGGTWVREPTCFANAMNYGLIDCAYALDSTAGATSIEIMYNGQNNHVCAAVIEYAYSGGPIALDGTAEMMVQAIGPTGPSFALSGTDDLVVQALELNAAITTIDPAYGPLEFLSDGSNVVGVGDALDVAAAAPATWQSSFGEGQALALAFKPI